MNKAYTFLKNTEILPPTPVLLTKLLSALSDVDSNFDEVVQLISLDQSLTAKLLQICNSPFFHAPARIGNVREAVTRIGYRPVYALASMISCGKSFQPRVSAGWDAGQLWKHSVATAYAAKFVAETAQADDNLIFTAGLLHDIGKIVLADAQPDIYIPLLKNAESAKTSPVEFEMSRFGCHHAELGAALLERWKLPGDLVDSVAFHHHPAAAAAQSQQNASCVFLGNLIAHGKDYPPATGREDYQAALDRLKLDAEDITRCERQLEAQRKAIEEMTSLRA
jgi:putative nucleotidyltransferase with HDIG domain